MPVQLDMVALQVDEMPLLAEPNALALDGTLGSVCVAHSGCNSMRASYDRLVSVHDHR